MSENVNHPLHYSKEGRKECIEEMLDIFDETAVYIWCVLNHYKYNYRKGEKENNSEEQDIKKGEWYLDYISKLNKDSVPYNVVRYAEEQKNKSVIEHTAKYITKDKESAIQFLKSCGIINEKGELSEEYKPIEYEYVDLGLPSGLKWCKTDVGAFKEGDYGLYFSWGGTVGYPDAKNGKEFTWGDYEFGDIKKISKYNETDGKTVLDPEDDAATVNMGEGWRMPTEEEYQELLANTTYQWIENYNGTGHNVAKLTSKVNGNYIIFPASGFCFLGSVSNVGSNGFFWTSSLSTSYARFGRSFGVFGSGSGTDDDYRCYGQAVRGVRV